MIRLKHVLPEPLSGILQPGSDIWETDVLLERGKIYSVFAPSGKGKSTFIHIIYGLRKDYTGEVQIDGTNTSSIKEEDWANLRQRKISVVFQDLRLFPALTALENIGVKSELVKYEGGPDIKELAEELGVANLLDRQTATLSYGERQRIAIIRSLVQPFDILLLDEPFSHIDKDNIEKASGLIRREAKRRNAGIVLTSLNRDEDFSCDTAYRL